MNAFVRPAKHTFVAIDEIDLSHTIRPYNASVVGELAQSIRAIGLQTPLTCVVRDGRHILVAGRNRLEALRLVGAEEAPVRVVDFDDVEAKLWRLSENLHRAELTKLQYDQQVVEYAEILKAKQAAPISLQHESEISVQERQPEAEKLRQLGAVYDGDGISSQAGAKVGRPESGNRLVARKLNIPEQSVRRAYQTASLSPEAQEVAVETGLDHNRTALLEAAKERTPEAQAATIRRLAERKTAPAEPLEGAVERPAEPTARPLRNLENLSGGKLAKWVKQTTPNDRPHVIRVLRMAADILEDELTKQE